MTKRRSIGGLLAHFVVCSHKKGIQKMKTLLNYYLKKVKLMAFTKAFLRAILKTPRRNENECSHICKIFEQFSA